jgi:hypothetical protein
MALKCGNCFHYRSNRCKNRRASTYNVIFQSESHGCQMHISHFLKPLDWGFRIIGTFVSIILLVFALTENSSEGDTTESQKSGFEL